LALPSGEFPDSAPETNSKPNPDWRLLVETTLIVVIQLEITELDRQPIQDEERSIKH
jgi:hypothetical protein